MLSDISRTNLQVLADRIYAAVSLPIPLADRVSNAISARCSRHFPTVVSESLNDLARSFIVVVKHGLG